MLRDIERLVSLGWMNVQDARGGAVARRVR